MPSVTTVYTATGTTGSCSSTQTISITVPPTSTVMVTSTNTLICASGVGTTLNASGASTYTWMPGSIISNTINANPLTTTSYTALGQTAAGCIAVPGVITVSVSPAVNPTITASSATVCLTKTVSISATPTGAGLSYTWAPASSIMGASNTATIVAKPTTTATVIYTLTLSNGLCSATSTVMLQVFDCVPPTATITTLTNDSICTNGCVTFSSSVTGPGPITYQWFFPGGTPPTSNQSNPQICYFAKGSYSVGLVVINPYGTDTIIKSNFISVTDTPAVVKAFGDTLILVGQTAPIYATGASSYQWYPNHALACNTCSSTIAQPTVTTQYIVTGSNSIYCKRTDTIVVRVDFICGDFFIPNVFSPNDDGLNDFVNVHGFCINTFNLQIFSRWGEKVFETTSKSDSWDGSFRGKKMDTGVFVYKVDGTTIDGKTFSMKGNITLLR
jgi:gliding motility-associated-like protein